MNTRRGGKLINIKRCATKRKNGERKRETADDFSRIIAMENREKTNLPADSKTVKNRKNTRWLPTRKPVKNFLKTDFHSALKPMKKLLRFFLLLPLKRLGESTTESRHTTSPIKPPHTHTVPQNPSERTPQRPHTERKQKNRPPHTPTKTATTSPQNDDKPSTTKQRHPPLLQQYAQHLDSDAHNPKRQQPNVQPCIKDEASSSIAK